MRSIPQIHIGISRQGQADNCDEQPELDLLSVVKGWLLIFLSFLFVGLYAAALAGWLRPVSDLTMIARLEPIIFAIIGYFFARVPSQQTEEVLKKEIDRQSLSLRTVQSRNDELSRSANSMEERIRDAKLALAKSTTPSDSSIEASGQAIALKILS